jgi:Cu(I)/Ag(I) efflux system membrane fusion protein
MKKIINNKWIILIIVLIIGILLGRLFAPSAPAIQESGTHEYTAKNKKEVWTCSMHPQIRMDKPGKCPICGMDLIPADEVAQEASDPNEVSMTDEAMKLAEVQTAIVEKAKPEKEIRLLGKIKPDERYLNTQSAHIPGRIEKLYVNFTGEKVVKGQKIARLYSPELVTAQKELFEAIKSKQTYPELYQSAKNKLKLWKLTDAQIEAIEKNGEVVDEIDILADYSGTVMKRLVELGDYVKEGAPLFDLADLSKLWVMFEAYETDLPWIHTNDKVEFTVQGKGNKLFSGKVNYIDPFVNAQTRIAQVRVDINNPNLDLLPEMYVNGLIKAALKTKENALIVPKSAVLWTGKRAIVYVKVPNRAMTSFIYREVILGEDMGDFYVVKSGLEEGEEIAVNGVFRIDASAQLNGKKSMMNPEGGKSSTGHNHGGMKMNDKEMKNMNMQGQMLKIDKSKINEDFKKQLGNLVIAYFNLKDKLVNDDKNIKKELNAFIKALDQVDMTLVTEDAHNFWMKQLDLLKKEANTMSSEQNLQGIRNHFLKISMSLKETIEKLGVKMQNNTSVYIDFCPMANENNGGYWLSSFEEIKNPYFGKKMLTCGEIKKIIK